VSDLQVEPDIGSLSEPWLRLAPKQGKAGATESAKAYEAFQVYYMASPNRRSLRQAGLQQKKSETLMEGWSRRFYWVLRTEAWDRRQAQIVADEFDRRSRKDAAVWADRKREVLEQDYSASRELVARGVQTMKLPLTERRVQKKGPSGDQITILQPVNRSQTGTATMIKVGHEISLDCIKRARPEPTEESTVDDYEFVLLPDPKKEGGGE
jgi:hypothetical protein